MNNEPSTLSEVSQCLRERNALVVHFSAPTSGYCYPDSLNYALAGKCSPLSCSAILPSDKPGIHTLGNVGLIVDIEKSAAVSVAPHDAGSSKCGSFAEIATRERIVESFEERADSHNEWLVTQPRFAGLLLMGSELNVRMEITPLASKEILESMSEMGLTNAASVECIPIGRNDVVQDFPNEQIFALASGQFHKWSWDHREWVSGEYNEFFE